MKRMVMCAPFGKQKQQFCLCTVTFEQVHMYNYIFKVLIRSDDSHMCLKFSSFVQMVSCVSEARVGCSLMAGDSVQSVLGQNTEPQTTLMHQYVCHKQLYPHTKAVCEWMNIV